MTFVTNVQLREMKVIKAKETATLVMLKMEHNGNHTLYIVTDLINGEKFPDCPYGTLEDAEKMFNSIN